MLDREFFSTDVIRTLEELGVGYLIPCVNTPNVVDAITEFSKEERPSVSRFRITKSKNDYAEYTMIITGAQEKRARGGRQGGTLRRKARGAVHRVCHKQTRDRRRQVRREVDDRDGLQDGGEREGKNAPAGASPSGRSAFLYSLVLFNAWVLANAELTSNPLTLGGVYSRFTQTDMKVIMLMEILPWSMEGGKPPPDPHCPCCTGATCRGVNTAPPLQATSYRHNHLC